MPADRLPDPAEKCECGHTSSAHDSRGKCWKVTDGGQCSCHEFVPVSAAVSPAEPPADPVVSPADTPDAMIRRVLNVVLCSDRMSHVWADAELALADLAALLAVGERDRQQIARLTEALKRIAYGNVEQRGSLQVSYADASNFARAVLADEEDARR